MNKKIGLIHYAYPPNIGGVEILMSEQANILADLGYGVNVITGSGKEKNPKIKLTEIAELRSVLHFNPKLQKKIVGEGIVDAEFYGLAAKIEQKITGMLDGLDVIIVHNMLTLIHNLPFIYAFKKYLKNHSDKKIIIWAHDQTFIDGEKILENKEGVKLSSTTEDLLMSEIELAKYVVISNTFKELFCKVTRINEQKVTVIPDGINIRKFLEIDDTIWNFFTENNLMRRFPIILSPVNILPRKNLEYNLEIVHQLKKKYPELAVIITGQPSLHRSIGNYYEEIKEKIIQLNLTKNVIFFADYFKKLLSDSEMHDLYNLADAVFYFSKSENFGLPILEANLAKTPIFVSDLKVFHEIDLNNITYIDTQNASTDEVVKIISISFANHQARLKYDLKTIIEEKLVPLL